MSEEYKPDEREAFEAWYERMFGTRAFAQNVDHSYADELTEMQWAGWQARAAWQRAQSAPVVPEGYVLVPVEPTEEMAKVGTDARWQSCVRDANCVRSIYSAMVAAAPQPVDGGQVK